MMIPPKLRHGDNLSNLFEKFNTVIDYLREIRLVAGNGIRINRRPAGTTIESTASAAVTPAMGPDERWHIDSSREGDTVLISVNLYRYADGATVIFRGKRYIVDGETFSLQSSDLGRPVYLDLVKTPYGGIRFRPALTHDATSDPMGGFERIATITTDNGDIKVVMHHDRMFEWPDIYRGQGGFAADMLWDGIPYSGDEPEILPFEDFMTKATQKLYIDSYYSLIVGGSYLRAFLSGLAGLIDLSEFQSSSVLGVYYVIRGNTRRYEVIPGDSYGPGAIRSSHEAEIRIPVTAVTSLTTQYQIKYRYIVPWDSPDNGINFPLLSINPAGLDWNPAYCSIAAVLPDTERINLSLYLVFDGVIREGATELSAPFSSFQTSGWLTINAYWNSTSHKWSSTWFEFNGTPLTTRPESGYEDRLHTVKLAYIQWDSTAGLPYISGQNFSRYICFSSARDRFNEFDAQISDIQRDLTNIHQILDWHNRRISALEAK